MGWVKRVGLALSLAVVAVGLVLVATRDNSGGEEPLGTRAPASEAPAERATEFPVPLHSEPPGDDGDVSRAFVDPDGDSVILNGVNMFPVFGSSRPWDRADYEEIAAKGFTAVRFLLRWPDFEPQPGRFQNLKLLDQAVGDAKDAGLYVVMLNIIVGDSNRPPAWTEGRDQLERIATGAKAWTQELARRYKDKHVVAAYDLAAELPSNDQNRVVATYSKLIGWVREIDRDKVVITTAGWGNSEMSPGRGDPDRLGTQRRNVVHSFHDYYAGDGDPARASIGYNKFGMNAGNQVSDGVGGYPETGDAEDLSAQLEHQADYARRAGVALWIGEYGINPSAVNAATWVEQKTELYNRAGLGRAWWLYTCGENFGLKDSFCNWRGIADAVSD